MTTANTPAPSAPAAPAAPANPSAPASSAPAPAAPAQPKPSGPAQAAAAHARASAPSAPPPSAPAGSPSKSPRRIGDAPIAPLGGFKRREGIEIGRRAMIFGPGGIGKSSLAALAPRPVFLDLQCESEQLNVARYTTDDIRDWDGLRAAVRSPDVWGDRDTLVIDNLTRAQQLATEWVVANIPDPKTGEQPNSIDLYSFGTGGQLRCDTFRLLLQDLDAPLRAGKNVVLIAHSTIDKAPNTRGEDWIRLEPDLAQASTGKSTSSIRNAVFQWCHHVLCIAYDVAVQKGSNVGEGQGSRAIYLTEKPSHLAKVRIPGGAPRDSIVYAAGSNEIWRMLGWAS